jgi:membrane-bound metal-dependent hydrolase YbcI (DUF457 family)
MDPLTHIVVSRAIVAVADPGDADEPARRGVAWAAILGALSPDVDAAVAPSGWDHYLTVHEIGTHSLIGAFAMACLTAIVVKSAARMRGAQLGLKPLLAAATAGAMSHVVLDVVSGARIRVAWPIVSPVVTLPLVAMADPWLIGICLIGLLALWPGRQRLRVVSRGVIAAATVLLVMKGALLARALSASNFSEVPLTAVEAQWGSLTGWRVYERRPTELRAWSIGPHQPASLVIAQPLGPGSPLADISRSLDAVQNFLAVHEYAFPVEKPTDRGHTEVLWSDLRYCWGDQPAAEEPGQKRLGLHLIRSCGVWVGALFGTGTLPLTQLVKVGAVTQTRPVRR